MRALFARALLACALLACALALADCSGATSDRGLDAEMIVSGAQFVEGCMPAAMDGPSVASLNLSSNAARPGDIEEPLSGALAADATAAAIGLTGDRGYWIVPAGLPDVAAPMYPTFTVTLSFSSDLVPGKYDLAVRAVDEANRMGPPETRTLTVFAVDPPAGDLVIALSWDTEADLDLHVVTPGGDVLWKGDIAAGGGSLDFDSNAGCVIDGRRAENAIWMSAPPSGHYEALVDTFALCDATFANWKVEARLHGKVVGRAVGESVPTDADVPHDRGAGVLALAFDVP